MKRISNAALFLIIILSVITASALILFFSIFEVYKTPARGSASGEARENLYLAAGQWLDAEGHRVIVLDKGSAKTLATAVERTALIYSSSFDWTDCSQLEELARNGLQIVIFIDDMGNGSLEQFLEAEGLRYRIFSSFNDDEEDDEEPFIENGASTGPNSADKQTASFDPAVFLQAADNAGWQMTPDEDGHIRLAGKALGSGGIYVTGIPYFMRWDYLIAEDADFLTTNNNTEKTKQTIAHENAAYSWQLSGALDRGKDGILIIRNAASSGNKAHDDFVKGFWERLFENKKIIAFALSLAAVIIIGFWMTFPSFGKFKTERVLPGISIRERFKMESEFFKAHHCLHVYLKPYAAALHAYYRKRGISGADIIPAVMSEQHIDRETASTLIDPVHVRDVNQLLLCRSIAEKILAAQAG